MMEHVALGGLDVSRLGLGCMGMSAFYTGAGQDDAASVRTLHRALDLGVTFFDTAEIYGPYTNEELLGRAFAGRWGQVVLATKFGMLLHRGDGTRGLDGTPATMRIALEGSLRRLGAPHVDLYYQHRMDPAVPVEETVGALHDLIEEGKIRHYGLSEASAATIRRAHAVHPVTAVQSEYSLWTRDPELEVLATVRELGIGFVPYSPLGRGFLTGTIRSLDALDEDDFRRNNPRFAGENLQRNIAIVEQVDEVARQVGATPAQVAIAWLLSKGSDIVPIPGTKAVTRLEENLGSLDVVLSSAQLARLSELGDPAGDRYPDMSPLNR